MMKRVTSLLLALTMCFSLCACAAKIEKVKDESKQENVPQKEEVVTKEAIKSYVEMSLEEKLEYKASLPVASADSFDNGMLAPAKDAKTGLWGYIDSFGNWVVEPKYSYAGEFSGSFAPVLDEYSEYSFIKRDGSEFVSTIAKKTITGTLPASGGYIAVSLDVNYDQTKVYLSFDGVSILHASKLPVTKGLKYDSKEYFMVAGGFSNGRAVAMRKTNASLLDDMKGIRANIENKGYYQSACIINPQGEVLATLPAGYDVTDYSLDENGLIIVRDMTNDSGFYGICDTEGNIVVECKYQRIEHCEGDQYLVCNASGFWEYITSEGLPVSSEQFEEAYPFSGGIAAVCKDGLWGAIDQHGKWVIEPTWDEFAPLSFSSLGSNMGSAAFSFGVAAARKGVFWAIIDTENNILASKKAYDCPFGNLSGNLMSFYEDGLWGLINSDGCVVVKPQFAELGCFN